MIDVGTVKQAMKLIAAYLGIFVVRAEQDGPRPALPFMEYKIMSQGGDPAWQERRDTAEDPSDPTKVIVTSKNDQRANISINFFGKDFTQIWSYAEVARDYCESETGKEALYAIGVFPRLISPEVNDRTSFLETEFEHRVGFDLALDGKKITTETMDAVDIAATIGDMNP